MRSTSVALAATVILWTAVAASGGWLTAEADGIAVEVNRRPDPPRSALKTTYTVRLVEAGKPVKGAQVTLSGRMADGMAVLAPLRPSGEAGVYQGDVLFTMHGPWDLQLRVVREGRRSELPMKEQVVR